MDIRQFFHDLAFITFMLVSQHSNFLLSFV